MSSRSPSRGPGGRSPTRSVTPPPRADSRSPSRRYHYDSRSLSRSQTPPARRNGGRRTYRSRSRDYRSRSRSWGRGPGRSYSREPSEGPLATSTKVVVERLTKNINEGHLYEIFGEFGPIKDLDLPVNRALGTNRGTAYILFDYEADAEDAIAHMHEATVDGATINVSIVLPRRKLSPPPPMARRGANIDPRVPLGGGRGGPPGSFHGGPMGGGGGRRRRRNRRPSPGRFGPGSDVYRPGSRSPSRSPPGGAPSSRGGGSRHRSPSRGSYSPPGRSPPRRGGFRGGGDGSGGAGRGRSRSRTYDSYGGRSRSGSHGRSHGYR